MLEVYTFRCVNLPRRPHGLIFLWYTTLGGSRLWSRVSNVPWWENLAFWEEFSISELCLRYLYLGSPLDENPRQFAPPPLLLDAPDSVRTRKH